MADSWEPKQSLARRMQRQQDSAFRGSLRGRLRQAAPIPQHFEIEFPPFNMHVDVVPPDDIYLGRAWMDMSEPSIGGATTQSVETSLQTLVYTEGSASFDSPDCLAVADDGLEGHITYSVGGDGLLRTDSDLFTAIPSVVLPSTAEVLDAYWVAHAYRIGGGDTGTYDPNDWSTSETYPDLRVRYNGDGTNFEGQRLGPLPFDAWDGVELRASILGGVLDLVVQGSVNDWPGGGLDPWVTAGPYDAVRETCEVVVDYLGIRVVYSGPAMGRLKIWTGSQWDYA